MTKNKHDHTATKKIKAWLFAIMLLLPFLFLLPTGLYYGLNQNAQLSERTETIEEVNYYNTSGRQIQDTHEYMEDQLQLNTIYFCEIYPDITFTTSFEYIMPFSYADEISRDNTSCSLEITTETNTTLEMVIYTGDTMYDFLSIDINEPSQYAFLFVIDENTNFNGVSAYFYGTNVLVPNGTNTTTTIESTNDISTSIINAWNSTWQNPLFSWTNYSPFYAPMQSFTNVFGINDMQIANVLTYLATITAIYIVFDIVIELFTYLTHLIPRND